jgi:succinoglycan biosynthesis protein ExoM
MSEDVCGVAIATYRRPQGLARLLTALGETTRAGTVRPRVVVVDNDGTDPEIEAVVARVAARQELDIHLVVETHPGISAARNRAFAEAEALGVRLLAMLDDDEWPAPGWLDAMVERCVATAAGVVSGLVRPVFGPHQQHLAPYRRFWSVLPQEREGKPFVYGTSNLLVDLAAIAHVDRPLFEERYGLSGGGDLIFCSRLFDLGVPMAWAEDAVAFEEVPANRASWAWIRQRRFRVGNHMVMDEAARRSGRHALLKTFGLCARLPIYPLLGREPEARLAGWDLELQKIRGRFAAHFGRHFFEYARDGVGLRPALGERASR